YNRLKAIASDTSLSMADRQIIEEIVSKSTDKARKNLRDLTKLFSKQSQDAANTLIDLGDKLTAPGQKALMQHRLLEDAQRAVTTGERPSLIMKAMHTPEGYYLTK